MKTITIQEAYKLLQESEAVMIDGCDIATFTLSKLNGVVGHIWLDVYVGEDGKDYFITFHEGKSEIKFDGSSLYIDKSKLTLLVPMNKLAEISI